jgi:hypothetical protein
MKLGYHKTFVTVLLKNISLAVIKDLYMFM